MPTKLTSLPNLEIPDFPDHPLDDQMEDSNSWQVSHVLSIKKKRRVYTDAEKAEIIGRSAVPGFKTYDDYIKAGELALEIATNQEKHLGIRVAGSSYERAATQFLGALTSFNAIDNPNPLVLLEYGSCMSKMVESDCVTPYKYDHPSTLGREHKADLKLLAAQTIERAEDMLNGAPIPRAEVIVPASIVASDRLEFVENLSAAKNVLRETSVALTKCDTDPRLAEVIDIFAHLPTYGSSYSRHDIATEALEDLVTGGNEYIYMTLAA